MSSIDHEAIIEEIRQLLNKSGCPEVLGELLTLLGLEEDYEPSSSEESSDYCDSTDDDLEEEDITTTLHSDGFYEIVDSVSVSKRE